MLHAVGRHQDRESFIALFRHFAPRIKSFLMKGGATPEQADELAQETMLTVWDKAQNYDPRQAGASTWIYTIARNKKIDALRKAGRVEIANADTALLESDDPAPSESVIRAEEIESIGRALKDLPREQALLLQKSFFEDKSHADIAAEMKLPLGTVKSRIRLALDKLRQDKGVKALW